MRILYDGQLYGAPDASGITRYLDNLIHQLPPDFSPCLTRVQGQSAHVPSHPNLKVHTYQGWGPSAIAYRLGKYYFRAIETLTQPDILHPSYYTLLTQQEFSQVSRPIVLTVYDMIYERFAEQLDPTGEIAAAKRKAILAAQAITCISENTKRDLLHYCPVDESKITVTYMGSALNPRWIHGPAPIPSQPYYLYVGSRTFYKNFDTLLIAFAKAVSRYPDLRLCVAGPPLTATEQQQIQDQQLTEHIHYLGRVDDRDLAKLYHHSVALVYPSRYEGFGIPALEAMSCGTTVIAANTASLPEVVGDGGLLFSPDSAVDLADRLLFLLEHPLERDRLIAQGQHQAKNFSWAKTSAQTVEVYRSVIHH